MQAIDHGEEGLCIDVLGLAGIEDVLLVVDHGVTQPQLALEHRNVHGVDDRTLDLDLEGLEDVDHRRHTELRAEDSPAADARCRA